MESDNKGEKYMKRKGFTLIELLAVIVILAIIAVITVPKIADMISSSRQGGAEDSFYGTLKAAELGYTKALQSNTNLKGSTCNITDSKITCTSGVNVEVSGKTPESGTLIIDSAGSTMAKSLTLNGYKCYGDLSTESPCVKTDVDVASETLIKKVTTTGDGLYKDSYEDGRYIFRGASPNNYIEFNDEKWRIISVEPDGSVKISRINNIGSMPFDKTGYRDKNSNGTGGTYCASSVRGCNVWAKTDNFVNGTKSGTVLKNSSLNDYLNGEYYKSLKSKAKHQIQNHAFYYGATDALNSAQTIESTYKAEKKYIWIGNIGLLQASDYVKATLNADCKSINIGFTSPYPCGKQNYLTLGDTQWPWMINAFPFINDSVFTISENGFIYQASQGATGDRGVWPTVHLVPSLQLSGTGTDADPYKIK